MKALSLRQPWGWLVVNGHKPLENRKWTTLFRGPFLIHASKGMTRDEYEDVIDFTVEVRSGGQSGQPAIDARAWTVAHFPAFEAIERGGIIGVATLVDVVPPCLSAEGRLFHEPCRHPWHMAGQYGFVLADVRPLPFTPWKGRLGFFAVPDVRAQAMLESGVKSGQTHMPGLAPLVVHCRREPFDVYIGRPGPWGNPFSWNGCTLAAWKTTQEGCLSAYEAWLRSQPELVARARRELRGKVLGCWCKPGPCHGDILARVAAEGP